MVYNGMFIEGHVPPKGVRLVLREKNIKGVASLHGVKSGRGGYEDNYEVVKFGIINHTMMHHSIHLHGMCGLFTAMCSITWIRACSEW